MKFNYKLNKLLLPCSLASYSNSNLIVITRISLIGICLIPQPEENAQASLKPINVGTVEVN